MLEKVFATIVAIVGVIYAIGKSSGENSVAVSDKQKTIETINAELDRLHKTADAQLTKQGYVDFVTEHAIKELDEELAELLNN